MSASHVTLKVTSGPLAGQTITCNHQDSVLVGRSGKARLRIEGDEHISRNHFLIEVQPAKCHLVDLNSANGTYVNNKRVTECWLRDGDTIQGGQTRITVQMAESADYLGETLAMAPADLGATVTCQDVSEQLGDYQLLKEIGKGSMGVVYQAQHVRSDQIVALKVVNQELGVTETVQQTFIREAGILCGLSHKRIVQFIEAGSANNRLFMVMEYVDALNLDTALAGISQGKRMTLACGLVRQMLDGLEHAHSHGLVHRDIKPKNLLVYKDGGKLKAKLADFGLAKNFADAGLSRISSEHEIKGTLCFMAPEQIISSRHAKPAADIFSAGATLYTLISGDVIYELSNHETPIATILNNGPVPLAKRAPHVPAPLCEFVDRALAHDVEDRFSSAREMRDQLRRLLHSV